jgi:hypothetical protein
MYTMIIFNELKAKLKYKKNNALTNINFDYQLITYF